VSLIRRPGAGARRGGAGARRPGRRGERLQRAASLASGLGAGPLGERITLLARRGPIRLAGDDAPEDPAGTLA